MKLGKTDIYVNSLQSILEGEGGSMIPQGNCSAFRPHIINVVSEAVLGHLKKFLNTVHRSVCVLCTVLCMCAIAGIKFWGGIKYPLCPPPPPAPKETL